MTEIHDLPMDIRQYYTAVRVLPDGRILGVHRLLYHWTMHIDISEIGYEDRYCYGTEAQATESMMAWDGVGDPPGEWHKHPSTERSRDPKTGEIWDSRLPRPTK